MQASISGGSHPYGERSPSHQAWTRPQGPTDTPIGCSSGPRSFHTEGEGVGFPDPSWRNCCFCLIRSWPAAGSWDDREGRALSWMWAREAPRVPSHEIHVPKLAEWTIAGVCPLLPGCPVPHPLIHSARGLQMGCGGPGLCSWCPLFSRPGQTWTVLAPTTKLEALLLVWGEKPQSEATLSTDFPDSILLKLPMAYRKAASQNSR